MKTKTRVQALFWVAGIYDAALGLMFFSVAVDPRGNRNLIPYGIMLKIACRGVVFGYWFASGLPTLWKPFAFLDAGFVLLFFRAWRLLGIGEV